MALSYIVATAVVIVLMITNTFKSTKNFASGVIDFAELEGATKKELLQESQTNCNLSVLMKV